MDPDHRDTDTPLQTLFVWAFSVVAGAVAGTLLFFGFYWWSAAGAAPLALDAHSLVRFVIGGSIVGVIYAVIQVRAAGRG